MKGDHRNYLYKEYAEFLKQYKPRFFVFENVAGLLSAIDIDGESHFSKMRKCFEECGYSIEYSILNARDYGVLQNRKRIILVGKRGVGDENFYPEIKRVELKGTTVDAIFSDLPVLKAGEGCFHVQQTKKSDANSYLVKAGIKTGGSQAVTFHIARPHNDRDLQIYREAVNLWDKKHKRLSYADLDESLQTHKNKSVFLDKFKVVAGDLPYSQTVVAHVSKDGHYYIHPDIKQNRSLTPREVARLQTFPDDYYFESESGKPSRTSAFKQIGNAVPVLLAQKVAEAMRDVMIQEK